MDSSEWLNENSWWLVILMIWSLVWKGFALWRAARKQDNAWFIALMVLNTVGILEIFYLFVFSKRIGESKPVVDTANSATEDK